ncbi:hypothetical protein [Janthinobacterium sp. GW458P]|nr:hypothetical protein [Janthinobacterium sp. GW458P]MBE3024347.1 hypothetical protein [Janthinobacterium sp. GW458P]
MHIFFLISELAISPQQYRQFMQGLIWIQFKMNGNPPQQLSGGLDIAF